MSPVGLAMAARRHPFSPAAGYPNGALGPATLFDEIRAADSAGGGQSLASYFWVRFCPLEIAIDSAKATPPPLNLQPNAGAKMKVPTSRES